VVRLPYVSRRTHVPLTPALFRSTQTLSRVSETLSTVNFPKNAGDTLASTVLAVTRHLPGTPSCHAEALSVGGSLGEGESLHQMKIILETDRLLLREYVEEDAEAFFKLNTDPEVVRFVPDKPLLNVEQARQTLIDHPIADYRKHGFGRGVCILKSTGEQIGLAGLKYLDALGEVDVAYRLLPAHWGQGLATEVAFASVRYGFVALALKRIIGLVMPKNIASLRVLEKTGLHYTEEVFLWGHGFSKYIIEA
jgi:ribosomal-protein-alanine N-acetyltransferase